MTAAARRILVCNAVAWAILVALGGCSETPPPQAPAATGEAAAAPVGEPAAATAPVEPIDAAGLAELLRASRGQVLVVNLWATWCAPCLREIPELVQLGEDLGPQGLRVIGISLDDADSTSVVEEFRDRWFPAFETYQSSVEWYALVEALDPDWSSVLPTSFVVDRSGARVATLAGAQSYETFADAVEPLL